MTSTREIPSRGVHSPCEAAARESHRAGESDRSDVASPGRVAFCWAVAGGILAGGLWPTVLFLGGQGAAEALLLLSTILFTFGTLLGFGAGALLGLAAYDPSSESRPVRSLLLGAVCLVPGATAAWLVALWMALLAPASRFESGAAPLFAGIGWLVGLAVVSWAVMEAVAVLKRALPPEAPRLEAIVLLALVFVLLLTILVFTEPIVWGVGIRMSPSGAIILSTGITIWLAGPVVVVALRSQPTLQKGD